jgi:hypothetical protein
VQRRFSLSLIFSLAVLQSACGGASPPASEPVVTARVPITRWEDESFGALRLGMRADALVAALGEPESRPEFVEMEATGERVATWTWPARGVTASLVDGADGATIAAFSVAAPSELRAAYGGIGVGSTREEVVAAYAELPDGEDAEPRETPERPDYLRIGNAYACLSFTFVEGRVSEIGFGSTGAE